MQFKLKINCENAAFGDDTFERHTEVARILRELASRVEEHMTYAPGFVLRDSNGNNVGSAGFHIDGENDATPEPR